jgi:PAS domain S-box-containing protein
MEVTSDGIFDWDLVTNHLYVSPRFYTMLGYNRDVGEASPQKWLAHIHPEDVNTAQEILNKYSTSISPLPHWRAEARMRKADGDYMWILTRGNVAERDASGKPVRILGTHIDLTERKEAEQKRAELEEQLRHAQKMEAVGQLAGGVAHDFNNFLQAINGYTELAIKHLPAKSKASANLEKVAEAGGKAADLVNQLLAFSRRQVMKSEVLDLNQVITNLTKMVGRIIGEHIHLHFQPNADVATVFGDRVMVDQILMNLCVNARDAMPEGGQLTIETRTIRLNLPETSAGTLLDPGMYVLLVVADTGMGMDEDTQERIFEPFFTTKATGKGTGLGLATVYGIVHQHKGMITVDSKPDNGTTFKVYLPVCPEDVIDASEKDETDSIGGEETILFAEDEQVVRELGKEILQEAGYTVIVAKNGREAITAYEQNAGKIDVAILDVVMPEMGGKEVFEYIRHRAPDLPTLFASGYSDAAINKEFLEQHKLTLLRKPFGMNELLSALRKVLNQTP